MGTVVVVLLRMAPLASFCLRTSRFDHFAPVVSRFRKWNFRRLHVVIPYCVWCTDEFLTARGMVHEESLW